MFWGKPREVIKLVEIEKPHQPGELSPELREAIVTLPAHPGFAYLMAKQKLQRSLLETALKNNHHKNLNEVSLLQSGIFWLNWLESQIAQETRNLKTKPVLDPTAEETRILNEIQATYQIIGSE